MVRIVQAVRTPRNSERTTPRAGPGFAPARTTPNFSSSLRLAEHTHTTSPTKRSGARFEPPLSLGIGQRSAHPFGQSNNLGSGQRSESIVAIRFLPGESSLPLSSGHSSNLHFGSATNKASSVAWSTGVTPSQRVPCTEAVALSFPLES